MSLPIEALIEGMRAEIAECRRCRTYIKATRKFIRSELRAAADLEYEANRIEAAWKETKKLLGILE